MLIFSTKARSSNTCKTNYSDSFWNASTTLSISCLVKVIPRLILSCCSSQSLISYLGGWSFHDTMFHSLVQPLSFLFITPMCFTISNLIGVPAILFLLFLPFSHPYDININFPIDGQANNKNPQTIWIQHMRAFMDNSSLD